MNSKGEDDPATSQPPVVITGLRCRLYQCTALTIWGKVWRNSQGAFGGSSPHPEITTQTHSGFSEAPPPEIQPSGWQTIRRPIKEEESVRLGIQQDQDHRHQGND